MSVIYTIDVNGNEYDYFGNLRRSDVSGQGTAVPFAGGVFFTAAHNLSEYDDYYNLYFKATINNQSTDIAGAIVTGYHIPNAYAPIADGEIIPNVPRYDKAIVIIPPTAAASQYSNNFVFFADNAAVSEFFSQNTTASFNGAVSFGSGNFVGSPAYGMFETTNVTQTGDSGGAASITDNSGDSYVVGILSQSEDNGHSIFTYLNAGDYYSAVNDMVAPAAMPFVVLFGYQSDDYLRGAGKGHASIIDDGNNAVILASSGDLINTGTGSGDVLYLPSATGGSDSGTTIVVSPGNTTIVGASALTPPPSYPPVRSATKAAASRIAARASGRRRLICMKP